jgi:hypothetical protein
MVCLGNISVDTLHKRDIDIIIIIIRRRRRRSQTGTSDMSTMNSNTRIVATCSLGTWFVSGI